MGNGDTFRAAQLLANRLERIEARCIRQVGKAKKDWEADTVTQLMTVSEAVRNIYLASLEPGTRDRLEDLMASAPEAEG